MNSSKSGVSICSRRVWYLDLLRIFTTMVIVLLHVTPISQMKLSVTGAPWNTLNIISSLLRWGVPVFFMISGALFLDGSKPLDTRRLYGKTILRMLASFAFWSAVYALVFCIERGKGKWTFLNQFLRGHYHMWYLFSIVSLYVIVPLLRLITQSRKATEYLLLLGFVFSFLASRMLAFVQLFDLPHADVIASLQSAYAQSNPYRGLSAVYYFVLGHYLHTYELRKGTRRLAVLAGAAGLALTAVLSCWHSRLIGETSAHFYDTTSLNVFAAAVGIFVLFKYAFAGFDAAGPKARVLLLASKCSFGVYLAHPLFIEHLPWAYPETAGGLIAGVAAAFAGVYLLSSLVSLVLNRLPVVNRYIV